MACCRESLEDNDFECLSVLHGHSQVSRHLSLTLTLPRLIGSIPVSSRIYVVSDRLDGIFVYLLFIGREVRAFPPQGGHALLRQL